MRRGYPGYAAVAYNSMSYHWDWTLGGSKEAHGFGKYFLKCLGALGHAFKGGFPDMHLIRDILDADILSWNNAIEQGLSTFPAPLA